MKINEQKNSLQKLEKEQIKQNKPLEGINKSQTERDAAKQTNPEGN